MKKNISAPKISVSFHVFPEEKQALVEMARAEDQSIDRLTRIMVREGLKARQVRKAETDVIDITFA
jgi:hypothetical protein